MRGFISLFTSIDWDSMENKSEYLKRVLKLADLGRMFLATDEKGLSEIAKKFNISLAN
jgi:hypothetical protein